MRDPRSRIRTRLWNRSQPDSASESGVVNHAGHTAGGGQWSAPLENEADNPQNAPGNAMQPESEPSSAWLPEAFSPEGEEQPDRPSPDDQRGPRWIEIARASADSASAEREAPEPGPSAPEPPAANSVPGRSHTKAVSPWLPPAYRPHDSEVVDQPPPIEPRRVVEASPWLPAAFRPTPDESRPTAPEVSQRVAAAEERPHRQPERDHETKVVNLWPHPSAEAEIPDPAPEPEPVAEELSVEDDSQPTTEFDAPGVVAALESYDRRLKAVESYCRELCPTDDRMAAARYALDALDISTGDVEVLLMATRVLAAEGIASGADGIVGSERIAGRRDRCSSTPGLLAAKANGSLSPREHGRLERHLDSCLVCRAAELRASRADRAFAAILELSLEHAARG